MNSTAFTFRISCIDKKISGLEPHLRFVDLILVPVSGGHMVVDQAYAVELIDIDYLWFEASRVFFIHHAE